MESAFEIAKSVCVLSFLLSFFCAIIVALKKDQNERTINVFFFFLGGVAFSLLMVSFIFISEILNDIFP